MSAHRTRGRRRIRRRGIVTIAAFVALLFLLVRHAGATMNEGGHRNVAERITRALIARDVTPVLAMFADSSANDIAEDVRLGAFADRLNAMGDLREVRYAGSGSLPDTQIFVATFTRGDVREELAFEGSRVIGFTLVPNVDP